MRLWPRKSRLNRLSPYQLLLVLLMTLLAVFMLMPIVFLFNHAFKPMHELFLYPPTFLVRDATWVNFLDLLTVSKSTIVPASRYLFNSLLTSVLTVVAATFISILCAFPLSKHQFKGKTLLFSSILVSLMFAPETVQIPRYYVISSLGIVNTYFAHILPMVALPVIVFLFKQFIDQIPNDLLESARMEGASEFRVFMNIIVPLCIPVVATAAILSFQSAWNNLEASQLFMEDETMKTLPFYVSTLTSGLANSVARQGVAAAAALLMFLPNFIIFLLLQSRVISTMAHSGIK
ncbi:carbohydrate ABC transporter permease [Paenibacillus mendelii]|uniref:Carbohydrate ABC transporter permease n=1 Tax=Paenibacillus mendelii TaxID=206163 RepID=A0ABV6JDH6_9BACL|nr:carbohydrate ABC transporter permease [Paenibacillus mendelii]MCQ6563535.1 carbohydrate ABC transporter permease [Paenibacillus mendelii]